LQPLEGLDGDVEVGRVQRLDGGGSPHQSFLCYGEEVRTPQTHVYAWGPAYVVASHPRPECDRRNAQNTPTWHTNCRCLESWVSVIARLGSNGVQRGHEDVYWFGLNVPTSSGELLVLLALESIVGVINDRERDEILGL
jgi:hypothetical protein